MHLSKIGGFKIILHREIEGKIKTCTIRNKRKDFAHKISRMLVDNYDMIKFVEFVNPAGTSQTCICGYPVPKDFSIVQYLSGIPCREIRDLRELTRTHMKLTGVRTGVLSEYLRTILVLAANSIAIGKPNKLRFFYQRYEWNDKDSL